MKALYNLLLNRPADANEVNGWVNALPHLGRQGVAAAILGSTEYRGISIKLYYSSLLHRPQPPSAAEVNFWINSKNDLLSIAIAMEGAPEFYAHGG